MVQNPNTWCRTPTLEAEPTLGTEYGLSVQNPVTWSRIRTVGPESRQGWGYKAGVLKGDFDKYSPQGVFTLQSVNTTLGYVTRFLQLLLILWIT